MLTIEELKALPVREWVWIAQPKTFFGDLSTYYQKSEKSDGNRFVAITWADEGGEETDEDLILSWDYSDYGTKWLAYKNKEQAEGKLITLPYLLCTSSKFACVIWRDTDGKVKKTYTMPIHEAKGVLEEKRRIQWKD